MKKIITFILTLALIGAMLAAMTITAMAATDNAAATDAAPAGSPAETVDEAAGGDITFIDSLGIAPVAAIVVICLLVGKGVKISPLDNEAIPVIVGVVGGILGVVGLYVMPDFPAADVLTAIAVGIVSGLAATGAHQVYKKIKGE